MEEIWKDVIGFEGYYQASNYGSVKSLERKVKCSEKGIRIVKERILKQKLSVRGYLEISLSKNNKVKVITVHKVIAHTFLNKPYLNSVVNHINLNKTDNKITNLEFISHRENDCHSIDKLKTTSKFIGVRFNRGKWESNIRFNGKRYYLGRFTDELDAYKSYISFMNENKIVNKYVIT